MCRHHACGLIGTTPQEKDTLKEQPGRNTEHDVVKDEDQSTWHVMRLHCLAKGWSQGGENRGSHNKKSLPLMLEKYTVSSVL